MIVRCGATTAVPDLRSTRRIAGFARPIIGGQERRAAGAAARGRRAAPDQPSPAVGLGRSCGARRVGATPALLVTATPGGDTGHRPAVASALGREEMDLP